MASSHEGLFRLSGDSNFPLAGTESALCAWRAQGDELAAETSMEKTIVRCHEAPSPVGPYSQGVILDGWIWTSGQVALDPMSATLTGADAPEQADRALKNIDAILKAAGSNLDRAVRVTVYLTNMDDFAAVNKVYARYFPAACPARSCVEVSRLPLGALVEIDALAKVSA